MDNALILLLWGLVIADYLCYFSALFSILVPVLFLIIYIILGKLHNLSPIWFS